MILIVGLSSRNVLNGKRKPISRDTASCSRCYVWEMWGTLVFHAPHTEVGLDMQKWHIFKRSSFTTNWNRLAKQGLAEKVVSSQSAL
ncbi:hypothetical protein HOLleu_34114 [Holothuria leucospilota]|uniref:Uncharacterized protein n=1 Tax=Holothuria leucospilota TaxID=206669 RepID=A0A9Q0YPY6_HOLLE|nr:hypothetical protein HOLleu_34114 [Holothuria leucospilota]